MMDNGLMENKVDKESIIFLMGQFVWVYGKMEKELDGWRKMHQ